MTKEYESAKTPADFLEFLFNPEAKCEFLSGRVAGPVGLKVSTLGKINVKSGFVYPCDPIRQFGDFLTDTYIAFPFPLGQHHVQLLRFNFRNGEEHLALARVVFSTAAPVQWIFASQANRRVTAGIDVNIKMDMEDFGACALGTDSGLGAFIDKEDYWALAERVKIDSDYVHDILDSTIKDDSHADGEIMWELNQSRFPVFSHLRTGLHPCYVGLDERGAPCRLVCDMFFHETDYQNNLRLFSRR